ncbi:DUF58 domain-containing protein [Alkalihalobacterium elongatum]|uniref:DUF58 domain-containing protein n=1 Tax=Alkalihalobacterium elongatum TaxID=2675466 RepID=UPI001C1FB1A2|nr:DUF58 domain-containing protein [Alkalihalobacterium elongatum]
MNHYYLKYISRYIIIPEDKTTVRMFPGDEGTLKIPIENPTKLPIPNGELTLFFYGPDEAMAMIDQQTNKQGIYTSNVAVLGQQKVMHHTRVKALKRGIVQLRTIEYTIYDFINSGKVRLGYRGRFRGELIVYPSLVLVQGLQQIMQRNQGERPKNHSVHEDVMMAMGTRDYSPGDPFNRIDWKATARTNSLQTKIFETTTILKWCVIVNIQSADVKRQTINNLEQVLSHVAYTLQFATKHQVSYELFINMRGPRGPFIHLPIGSGKDHLLKALELLARVSKSTVLTNSSEMLQFVRVNSNEHTFFLHFGALNREDQLVYKQWELDGATIYRVYSNAEAGQVLSVGGELDEADRP